ncbi:ion channel [Nevskia soli]|jgi:inward rectifier potassium channel|uniref:ion channel n=1 Tax=Nevskia soli TaxID=418856 RepID=UPI0015D8BD6F|nr:ion channel [Nevskia soli]
MNQPSFDPGLTQKYDSPLRRTFNADGSFNVVRRGTHWRDIHPYLHLVSVSWSRFFGFVLTAYVLVNVIFASIYFALGPESLAGGMAPEQGVARFLKDVFFSSQTLTTVGFGAIYPNTTAANAVAAIEALVGLLGFAVVTGLLFGRVSRPSARIGFSERALIAPYQGGTSLQFRVVNRRANSLMEMQATVTLMRVKPEDGGKLRSFDVLNLERSSVIFFPLTWTVVHPIDNSSPLNGKTPQDLAAAQAEILIVLKAWDETFSQTVYQRFSYRYDEIVWGGKFTPAFHVNGSGDLELEVDRVGAHEQVPGLITQTAAQSS